jgi:hypothetical protein
VKKDFIPTFFKKSFVSYAVTARSMRSDDDYHRDVRGYSLVLTGVQTR